MPTDTAIVLTGVIALFLSFAITLGWVSQSKAHK